MMTFFIIVILLLLVGGLSYFTSARFGLKASNTDRLPPYYAHLMRRLKEKEKQEEKTEAGVQDEATSVKR